MSSLNSRQIPMINLIDEDAFCHYFCNSCVCFQNEIHFVYLYHCFAIGNLVIKLVSIPWTWLHDQLSKTRTHIAISDHLLSLLCFEGPELIANLSINCHIVIGHIANHNCLINNFFYSSILLIRPLSTKAIPLTRQISHALRE